MDTRDALHHLRKAKTAHLKWRTYAQALAAGVSVGDDKAPLQHTGCDFGRWHYGPGQSLREVTDLYEDIEEPHRLLHEAYAAIYELARAGKYTKASDKLRGLESISTSLMAIIDACVEDIRDR